MFLKSNEICKFGNKCPYAVSGYQKCFGLKENRNESFNCAYVDEEGIFINISKPKKMQVDVNYKVM